MPRVVSDVGHAVSSLPLTMAPVASWFDTHTYLVDEKMLGKYHPRIQRRSHGPPKV